MNIRKILTCTSLLLILITLILFFGIGQSVYQGKSAKVLFLNKSGHTITHATVSVSGKSCSVQLLLNNGQVQCAFEALTDSGYIVEGALSNGDVFNSPSLGYVTGGLNFNHTLVLNSSNEVTLNQESAK